MAQGPKTGPPEEAGVHLCVQPLEKQNQGRHDTSLTPSLQRQKIKKMYPGRQVFFWTTTVSSYKSLGLSSVVVPTWNAEDKPLYCTASVLDQNSALCQAD